MPGACVGCYAVPVREVARGQSVDEAAAGYLTWLLSVFGQDARAALAAYVEGPHLRTTWIQLRRDWSSPALVLDAATVRFVEAVMTEAMRRAR